MLEKTKSLLHKMLERYEDQLNYLLKQESVDFEMVNNKISQVNINIAETKEAVDEITSYLWWREEAR